MSGYRRQPSFLSISQLILYNRKQRRKTSERRHTKKREPPLPIYVGLNIYSHTPQAQLVDNLFELGMSLIREYLRLKMTLDLKYVNNMKKKVLFVPESCAKCYLLLQHMTIYITIQPLILAKNHFMELEYPYSSIRKVVILENAETWYCY